MTRRILAILVVVACSGCDIRLDLTDSPPASPTGPTITNTNTNTSTNTNDRADTGTPTPAPSGTGGGNTSTPAPLPSYGESVTRDVAAANPGLVANSCQDTNGERAWEFLDLVIKTLRNHANDQRWGYLCKDGSCTAFARDIVAYKASSGDTGIWIVDVIGNHCPGPTDSPAQVRWGVLPFETVRRWSGTR